MGYLEIEQIEFRYLTSKNLSLSHRNISQFLFALHTDFPARNLEHIYKRGYSKITSHSKGGGCTNVTVCDTIWGM